MYLYSLKLSINFVVYLNFKGYGESSNNEDN